MNKRISGYGVFKCAITLAYAYFIYVASSKDTSSIWLPLHIDKIIHFAEFGLLCLMICWSFFSASIREGKIYNVIVAITITSLYAVSDEIHQYFTPNRSIEFLDWLADTGGAVTAGLLWRMSVNKRKVNKKLLAMDKTTIKM